MAVLEVFWRFLALGCVSFGGPAAHIGYFRKAFVEGRAWLDEGAYARLVALGQFLPGPASSQVGFAIGLQRAGLAGGLAAFLGFTLPSFLLMYALAVVDPALGGSETAMGIVHGLKLLAVVVVAEATAGLYQRFCERRSAAAIAAATAALLLVLPGTAVQMAVLGLAAALGAWRLADTPAGPPPAPDRRLRALPLALFAALFLGLPLAAAHSTWLQLGADFYRTGSLVFGGGHVVLPLLGQSIGDALPADVFLSGYAAAQAMPGPMFSLAAFLGAALAPGAPLAGALLATLGIFLPGFLLLLGLKGAWESLSARPRVAGAVAGINAAVVGLLMAALYQPVFTSAVAAPRDMALVLAGFLLLRVLRLPVVLLVLGFAAAGAAMRVFL